VGTVAVVALSPNAELALGAGGEGCELRSGSAHFEVAKLGARSFSVKTPDATVVVHGTAFRVTVDPAGATPTQVVVSEGVVSVRGSEGPEARLVAGDRWPPGVTVAPAASASASPASMASGGFVHGGVPAPLVHNPMPTSSGMVGVGAARRSDLSVQNELLADAASARKRGDAAGEARALDAFIARFPQSPGAHDAVANRVRAAVRSGDRSGAAREGRRYLQMFPGGPLREEALAAVGGASP
jgi:hypothetical protein